MTDIAFSRSVNSIGIPRRGDPRIAGTAVAFTANRYDQDEVAGQLTEFAEPGFARFSHTSGVEYRNLALPVERYPKLTGFTEANEAYLEVAVELGEQAVRRALDEAHLRPDEVDAILTVSSTGVAVPTIDARIASKPGLRSDVKRIPMFGLGCVAGAAATVRQRWSARAPIGSRPGSPCSRVRRYWQWSPKWQRCHWCTQPG